MKERYEQLAVGFFIGILCGMMFSLVMITIAALIVWRIPDTAISMRMTIVFSIIGSIIGLCFGNMDGKREEEMATNKTIKDKKL